MPIKSGVLATRRASPAPTAERVVLDGVQRKSGRPRQRFRCISSDGSYRRFIGALGRTRSNDHTCVECENNTARKAGAVPKRKGAAATPPSASPAAGSTAKLRSATQVPAGGKGASP